jgi:hypothetical protein
MNTLNVIVNMRSSDLWLGLPYDIFNFSMIGLAMAAEVDAAPGSIRMHLGSAHIYEKNFSQVKDLLLNAASGKDGFGSLHAPWFPGYPPAESILQYGEGVEMEGLPAGYKQIGEALRAKTKADALEILRGNKR